MDIKVKKLKKNTWEMRLIEPLGEYIFGSNLDLNTVREKAEELHSHDNRVKLIQEELTASAFFFKQKTAYDQWHWYDKIELDRFLTMFLLKHGEK